MKKYVSVVMTLGLFCLIAAGCADKSGSGDGSQNLFKNTAPNTVVDVDLTVMDGDRVYAEVYNIMINPDDYLGKVIKGSGVYDSFYYEKMDRYFHYFIISDATGCCPEGLDFVWNGEHSYPEDYPEIGGEVEVTGLFTKGEIDGEDYYYLAADTLRIL